MASVDSTEMWSRAARIESFNKPQKKQKKRASTQTKKTLTAKWPHETPTADQLARAGFYFHFANDEDVDSTRCFACGLKLDGWEPDDDPVKEHIAHIKDSERCVWATCISVIRSEGEESENRDPLCDVLFNARKETFGDRWPHESKRNWKCKVDRMAEAGWSFDPSPEDADGVTCHYCGLELSGFEPKDDPYQEHKRRKPSCRYFELIDFYHQGKLPKRKKTKAAKSRSSVASKASRTSMRSVISTTVSEDVDMDDGATDILANDELEQDTGASRTVDSKPKRASRPKPAAKVSRPRKKAASQASEVYGDEHDTELQEKPKRKTSKKASNARTIRSAQSHKDEQTVAASSQLQAELEHSILESSPNYWVNPERESSDSVRGTKRTSDGSAKIEELDESDLNFPLPPVIAKQEEPKSKRAKPNKQPNRIKGSSSASSHSVKQAIERELEDEEAIAQELARIEEEERVKASDKHQSEQSRLDTRKKPTSQAIRVLEDESCQDIPARRTANTHVYAQPTDLTPSPTGSDKENDPSSLEAEHSNTKSTKHGVYASPTKTSRMPLAQATPNSLPAHRAPTFISPSKRQLGTMTSSVPWTTIDIDDAVLLSPSQNTPGRLQEHLADAAGILPQAQREMTVEAWIKWRAGLSEDELKRKCEEMVGRFEREGNRALECLHGLGVTA